MLPSLTGLILRSILCAPQVLLRGSNKLALDEAERSLHDALCVVRCLVQVRGLTGAAKWLWVEDAAFTMRLALPGSMCRPQHQLSWPAELPPGFA